MKMAPPTKDEAARLKVLYDYEILDTEAETIFLLLFHSIASLFLRDSFKF